MVLKKEFHSNGQDVRDAAGTCGVGALLGALFGGGSSQTCEVTDTRTGDSATGTGSTKGAAERAAIKNLEKSR